MRVALPALALAALAACAVALPEPDLEMAGGSDEVLSELHAGRRLYVDKCSGCHALISPERHSDEEWPREVDEMLGKKKIRLAPGERRALVRYLTASNGRT